MPGFGRNIHRAFVGADSIRLKLAGQSGWVNGSSFPTQTVGADRIRPKLAGLGCTLDGKGAWFLPLGFPRGEAGRLDGSSEPARLTDEGQRTVG